MTDFATIVESLHYASFGMLMLLMGILFVVAEVVTPKGVHVPAAKWCFAVVFFGYLIAGFLTLSPNDFELVAIAVRGLVFGTIAFNFARMLIPLSSAAIERGIGGPLDAVRRSREHRRRMEEDRRRAEEKERMVRESREEWEREAPAREQARLAEDRRKQMAAADQLRRENARAACELAFVTHAPDLNGRFSREDMERFVSIYMRNEQPVEEIERRGTELRRIIEQHRQTVKPEIRPRTISQLSEWYLQEKGKIDALPLESDIKEFYISRLDERFSDLTNELLEKMEP